jgi:hypothetical protein
VVVGVDADQTIGYGLGSALDALGGDDMEFDPGHLAVDVDPTVGVVAVAFQVSATALYASVAEHPRRRSRATR